MTYLQTAEECIVDLVFEQLFSLVVDTSPAPKVFVVPSSLRMFKDCGGNNPHH